MNCEVYVEDVELVWVEGKVVKVSGSEAEVIVNGSSHSTHRIIPLDKLLHQVVGCHCISLLFIFNLPFFCLIRMFASTRAGWTICVSSTSCTNPTS